MLHGDLRGLETEVWQSQPRILKHLAGHTEVPAFLSSSSCGPVRGTVGRLGEGQWGTSCRDSTGALKSQAAVTTPSAKGCHLLVTGTLCDHPQRCRLLSYSCDSLVELPPPPQIRQ